MKNIPKADRFPSIDKQLFGLKSLGCEVWQGMIFIRFDGALLSDLELGIASFRNQLREMFPVLSLDQAPAEGRLKAVNESMLAQGIVAVAR